MFLNEICTWKIARKHKLIDKPAETTKLTCMRRVSLELKPLKLNYIFYAKLYLFEIISVWKEDKSLPKKSLNTNESAVNKEEDKIFVIV